ncbi:MAG: prepilin-type N-terminal cleavage/methylation domain-containing protein [Opitutales bacterium]|jgi:prepilin-type N-terminal cleavage/methylation domain-containing protein|nr:prepilin-type N-terminal cleavage/methylation domain-containing protein [Opitutales bacterium]MDG2167377.1 prepilin-type N-terminal cleavage/methylation domain-containing protein [Opitutales bacterium]
MKTNQQGFTILEVLVAVVIFAGAATVLVASYINILSNFEASRIKTNFEEELAYVRAELQLISDVEEAMDGDEFDMGNGVTGNWYSEIEMTEIPNLFAISMFVDMVDAEGERMELTQLFYLLRPSWSEADEVDRARQDLQERMQDFRDDQQFGWDFKGI